MISVSYKRLEELMAAFEGREPTHCDDFIHPLSKAPAVLRFWLFVNRHPAVDRRLFDEVGVKPKPFADFDGKRVRCVMASRLGDIGITDDLNAENGYDLCVPVELLSNFSDKPT